MTLKRDYSPSREGVTVTESHGLQCWQDTGRWFRYGENAIFTRLEGEGEVVLLLHGFPTASWDWHCVWQPLVSRYRVLATDMLGFGFSDKPVGYPYSIIDQADLQQGLLAEMGIERVHIWAHDYGGSVAQELLARDQEGELPFVIDSVCFLNGALFPEVHRPIVLQNLLLGPLGPLVSRVLTRRVFEYNLCKIFGRNSQPTLEELDDLWQLLTYNNGRGIIHQLIHYMEERRIHRHRWVGALQQARQPVRLIWGAADPVSGRAMLERYRQLVARPDTVLLEGIGHYPHFEDPQTTVEHYLRFRQRVADGDTTE